VDHSWRLPRPKKLLCLTVSFLIFFFYGPPGTRHPPAFVTCEAGSQCLPPPRRRPSIACVLLGKESAPPGPPSFACGRIFLRWQVAFVIVRRVFPIRFPPSQTLPPAGDPPFLPGRQFSSREIAALPEFPKQLTDL